jgi:antitoxin VapB
MSLCIEHPDAEVLARQLAIYKDTTVSDAVIYALREQLQREQQKYQYNRKGLKAELLAIGKRCAGLPVLDQRSPEEIIGYNQYGISE